MAFLEYETVRRVQQARESEERMENTEDIFLEQLRSLGIILDKEQMNQARDQEKNGKSSSPLKQESQQERVDQDVMKVHLPKGK